jgi:hypothetical protein
VGLFIRSLPDLIVKKPLQVIFAEATNEIFKMTDNSSVDHSNVISVQQSVQRRDGITSTERYLKQLCDHSFLSLWSYPGVYRDQGRPGVFGDGKEVCDLLVVFQRHVILFSDKDCAFPDTGDLELDWKRWFKRAIHKSAEQIWGAERWIKTHPQRLFLDSACTQPFPIDLPSPSEAKFHRILVAHGASKRCKDTLGGSGSLIIAPHVLGDMHYASNEDGGIPFAIGQIDPTKGYIHVFDDTTLAIVMRTLDTITDFVSYLMKKEAFIQSDHLVTAAGEEDLLAYYLQMVDSTGEYDFIIPNGYDKLNLEEGLWEEFVNSPEGKAQVTLNQASHGWDELIERFNLHILDGTQYITTYSSIAQAEKSMRFFACEPRMRRRILSQSFADFLKKAPSSTPLTRVIEPTNSSDPYYVLLMFPRSKEVLAEEYRKERLAFIQLYCMVTKVVYPSALDIIGIATEADFGENTPCSEDAVYLDTRNWTEEHEAQARQVQQKLGFYKNVTRANIFREYPTVNTAQLSMSGMKGRDRNSPCPCDSGKKYKKCCGR